MLLKKSACGLVVVLVVLGSLVLRSAVWNFSSEGEPDASGMLVMPEKDILIIADAEVPLAGAPFDEAEGTVLPAEEAPADELFALLNEERAGGDLEALKVTDELNSAAAVRAEELSAAFSHTRPNGDGFKTVLKENGISYRLSGENIAGGFSTAEEVLKAWLDNEGFRKNILNPDYTNVGVGYYDDAEQGIRYWCLLFVF